MSAGDAAFQPGGDILSRYRLQDRIGEGELGVVYRAEQIQSGEVVAVKFLRTCRHRDHVAPLLQELAPLVELEHKHLVRLVDIGKEGVPCLVYEYLQGASLARLLAKHERLAPAAALRILKGLADGLAFLHQGGRAHGALSTGNVLLDRQGKAKLADIGWARLATLAGAGPPTPAAPLDQLVGGETRGLGALLFEMLVGQPPGRGTQLSAMLVGVPESLERVAREALEGSFGDPGALRDAVKELLDDKSIGGRKTAYEPLGKQVLESASRPLPAPPPTAASEHEAEAEGERRRRSDVLRAVGDAKTHQKPRIPGLKVDVGQRTGPTLAQLMLVVLSGLGAVGGLAWYSQQRLQEDPERPVHVGVGTGSQRPETDLTGVGQDTGSLGPLTRAIVEEPRIQPRMVLVQKLLREHPREAPDALATVLQGGNERIRAHLLPVLAPLDPDGSRRLTLLRHAVDHDSEWPLQLTVSLARGGLAGKLQPIFASRQGPGALVALAGSTWGSASFALELETRFERAFFEGEVGKRKVLLERWVTAAGGAESTMARFLAATLAARASTSEDRVEILEVLGGLSPSANVRKALAETVERLGYGWGAEAQEAAFGALRVHADGDEALSKQLESLERKVRGY